MAGHYLSLLAIIEEVSFQAAVSRLPRDVAEKRRAERMDRIRARAEASRAHFYKRGER